MAKIEIENVFDEDGNVICEAVDEESAKEILKALEDKFYA